VRIHKFESVDAFVAIDLSDTEASSGPVRWARKVLQGGAKDLARSQTYTYALLGMRRGGASAGISADGPDRASAVEGFVAEAAALVADGTYLPDAAKGVGYDDLASLVDGDPRDTVRLGKFAARCEGLSAAVVAQRSVGGLDGRTVAIEGFAANGPALAASIVERGGRVISVSTAEGTAGNDEGISDSDLAWAWTTNGAEMVKQIGTVEAATAIFGSGADVMFVGSKMGIVDHGVATQLTDTAAVVPCGRLPLTARALAVLRGANVAVPADFVALAGSSLAAWGDSHRSDAEILAGVAEDIGDLSAEFSAHDDGPFLAACLYAEAFLSEWQDELPFGRPLAP